MSRFAIWSKNMALYGIADLHLSFSVDKPMDIYGPAWENNTERVAENWQAVVEPEDTVFIAGDISWGLKLSEALADLEWIDALPGKKVFLKGNHDPWWTSVSKLNRLSETMHFMQNDFVVYEDRALCGSRGWLCPGSSDYKAHDEKIYRREQLRLRSSLEEARKAGFEQIIGFMHFPPMNEKREDSDFTKLFEEFGVKQVYYGHLHGDNKEIGRDFTMGGTVYSLISCDFLGCAPKRIL